MDMGPDTLFGYMLESKDIHHHSYSQLNKCEGIKIEKFDSKLHIKI
jgi:hypothetical protein